MYTMPNTDIHENICLLIHYLLQCAKLPNLKVIKPINVHGILLTAVHDGGTGEEQYFPDESLYCLPNSNSVTLKNWTAVAHSQQPAQQ